MAAWFLSGLFPRKVVSMSAVAEMLRLPENTAAHFSAFLNHAPVGLAVCDSRGQITTINGAFETLVGIQQRTTLYLLTELMASQDNGRTEQLISELFAG